MSLPFVPQTLKRWKTPQHYSGTQWHDYFYAGVGQSRDSDVLERTNFASMLDALGGESSTVIVSRAGHWAVGWVEAILIHESDSKSLRIADEIAKQLEGYPVIDDMAYSEACQEEVNSTYEFYLSDFRKTVCEMAGLEFDSLSKAEQDEVDAFSSAVLSEDDGYRGHDDAFVTEESVMRYLCDGPTEYDGLNLTTYLKTAFDVQDDETYWHYRTRLESKGT